MNLIRTWNSEIRFFFTAQILKIFGKKQISKFKNIFFEFLPDNLLWIDIEKMISLGNITLISDKLYTSSNFLKYSPFSRFMLELYFIELDRFFIQLSSDFNMTKNLVFNFNGKTLINKFFYIPIKLQHLFSSSYVSLRVINKIKFSDFKRFVMNNLIFIQKTFLKNLNYVRYIDYILIGIISSKETCIYLERKILSFIRGNLILDIISSKFFPSNNSFIPFLGFHIHLIDVNFKSFIVLKSNNKYFKRLLARTNCYKKRLLLETVSRINSEMIFYFFRLLKEKSIINISWVGFRFWTYIFQIESLRFFRYNKLVFSKENIGLFSEDFLTNLSFKNILIYNNYLFDFQINKLAFLLREMNLSLQVLRYNNILSLEMTIQNYLDEFRKLRVKNPHIIVYKFRHFCLC